MSHFFLSTIRISWAAALFLRFSVSVGQGLDFQAAGYPTGATNHNYSSIGSPPVDVNLSISGHTDRFTPVTNPTKAQPRAVANGLQTQVNFETSGQSITVTISFSEGVSNLRFGLFNIDQNYAGMTIVSQDEVTVAAFDRDTPVTPSINGSAFVSVSGTTITGTANDPGSSETTVQFSSYVDKLVITYKAGPNASSPGQQSITLGDLSWMAPLPVHLILFRGIIQDSQVLLAWETSYEQGSDYFDVQRSPDGLEFVSLGQLKATRNTTERCAYRFTDPHPLPGIGYYRLKQVDTDGSIDYSPLIAVIAETDVAWVTILENPTDGSAIRIITRNLPDEATSLISVSGQRIPVRHYAKAGQQVVLVPTQPLMPGPYFILAQQGTVRQIQKVLVR